MLEGTRNGHYISYARICAYIDVSGALPKAIKLISLQGKDPVAEVVKEVFSVIKLAKIVKKTYATTFVSGNGGFGRAFNGNSTQLKKKARPEVIADVFSLVLLSGFNTSVCIGRQRTGVV